tara:strand:- start:1783 stop:2013 length:231 start_codon:yes stop_codon:yes gene_type:complete
MAKQKFELTADIISDEVTKNTPTVTKKKEAVGKVGIHIQTTRVFRSELKIWGAKKDMSLADILEKGFELLKNKYGD